MWYLLIVFSQLAWGTTVLEKFDSYRACMEMQVQVVKHMTQAYPGDRSFEIVCRFQASARPSVLHLTYVH